MTIDRSRYALEVEDTFESTTLDPGLWIPYYLPHWSSRQASAARYSVGGGSLRLRIDADQPPWAPEWDGYLRVSSLQTGVFAGALGTGVGQHRFRDGLIVREAQEHAALYTPRYGLFEIRARALEDPSNMVALWMIGLGDPPEQSAEICVFEIFGRDVQAHAVSVGMGVHPHGDPTITDAFAAEHVAIDAREAHWYAAEWTPDHVTFYVDERPIKVVQQSPSYPMAFMLDIYEFADGPGPASPPDRYPKEFIVEAFRGWRPIGDERARLSGAPPSSP